jgi:hypothetical protein|tara:strand:+ start:363 stop:599 length:237 start_codon:yes stop_codon:yes gene_type:complete
MTLEKTIRELNLKLSDDGKHNLVDPLEEGKMLYKSPTGWKFEKFGDKVRITGKNVDTVMNIPTADFKVLQRIIGQVKS